MTTSIAAELGRRTRSQRARRSMPQDWRDAMLAALEHHTRIRFPSPRYRADPVAFFREILGVEPWRKQVEVLEAIRDHPRVAVRAGHKVSKDLANDTPVLTPRGWTTHGALRVGDEVFAPDGTRTRIVSTTRHRARPMMRVYFEDGSHIDASETHDWVVRTRELRKSRCAPRPAVKMTTRELFESQRVPNGPGRSICNFTVDLPAPLQMDDAKGLPIDPYLLGLWLGDGAAKQAVFTGIDGLEQAFASAGYEVTPLRARPSFYVKGLLPDLRHAGVLGNKHVPDAYKLASAEQRLALLRGLMDTDGCCTARGRASFANTNRRLADDVAELARSLGQKVRIAERRAALNGEDCGPCWVVQWASSLNCFALERKSARLKTSRRKKAHAHRRIAIERVEGLDGLHATQCIEVDHPSHLYLAGRSLVPTHNSHTIAGVALWYYCSYDDARVVLTSTTSRQVDQILWRELRMMRARGGRCIACKEADPDGHRITRPCEHSSLIEGEQGELARTGLKSADFREIVGFTAREAEAVAGISGRNLLYLPDEASGIADAIFEAIEGNRAGGARIAMFSNPTRNTGEFFEAFASKSHLYKTITISSEETPNVVEGREVIRGLATREWIEEKKQEWGEASALYKVRVKGEHALHEEGKIFSLHAIEEAEQRWHETKESGRLYVGLDPAGPSGSGDETAMCPRRGSKVFEFRVQRGLSEEAHVTVLLQLLKDHRLPREVPVVVVDREGSIGSSVFGLLRAHLDTYKLDFELVAIRASDRAMRQPEIYDRQRDALTANLEAWFRDGGAIPEDVKLEKELHVMEWRAMQNGRLKVTAKEDIRKELGRSPDRYDALALSCWEPLSLRADAIGTTTPAAAQPEYGRPAMDPYAGGAAFDPRRRR